MDLLEIDDREPLEATDEFIDSEYLEYKIEYFASVVSSGWASIFNNSELGRFEQTLLNNADAYLLQKYAVQVLGERWIKAEPVINSDPEYAKIYWDYIKSKKILS